ncbi:MAG: hypothetical protein ACHREM_23465 [Polyangiales bacterium]
MSVTFVIVGDNDEDRMVNLSNANARDVLRALGAPGVEEAQPEGTLPGPELARLCMRFLATADDDVGVPAREPLRDARRARLIICARRPGYVRETIERIAALAVEAGGREVSWG